MNDFRPQHEEFALFLLTDHSKGQRKRVGDEVKGRCPLAEHEDKNPSFSYNVAVGAWACSCGSGKGSSLWQRLGWHSRNGNGSQGGKSLAHSDPWGVADKYDYRDEKGNLLFQVWRYAGKQFVQYRPDGKGGWVKGTAGVRRVLYCLPEVLRGPDPVLVVEGEKDVKTARALGLNATCNPGGVGMGWRGEFSQSLAGRNVVILPDNDAPGLKHAQKIETSLKGVAQSVRCLPFVPSGKDLSDWAASGATAEDIRRFLELTRDPGQEAPEKQWAPPIPLAQYKVPRFPTRVYPEWLRSFTESVAQSTETPVDMAAVFALGVLSAASAKKAIVRSSDNYYEPLNLYTAVALPTGNLKSPVHTLVVEPIRAFERERQTEQAQRYQIERAKYEVAEERLKHAKSQASKAEGEDRIAAEANVETCARDLAKLRRPSMPRLTADDVTMEKLTTLMAENRGRIALFSDEGTIFGILAGRYSEGKSCYEKVLQAYSGTQIQSDRVGRGHERVERPALTMCLAIQPDVLNSIIEIPGVRERGLLSRFLYAVPPSHVGSRVFDKPGVSASVRDSYNLHVRTILQMEEREDENGELIPFEIHLDDFGRALITDLRREMEPRLREDGDLFPIVDWCSKAHGALLRIAGLLHIAWSAEPGKAEIPPKMSLETLERALEVMKYFRDHALAAYGLMGADPAAKEGERILKWIRSEGLKDFSRRDAYLKMKGHLRKVEDIDPGLKLLENHGFIRSMGPAMKDGPGRTPSQAYIVNPLSISSESSKSPGAPNSEDCEDSEHGPGS